MELHILERALQECDSDMDTAIKSLHELCLNLQREIQVVLKNQMYMWRRVCSVLPLENARRFAQEMDYSDGEL